MEGRQKNMTISCQIVDIIPSDGYTLILEDDFNGSTIDTNKWNVPNGNWQWPATDLDSNNVSVSNGMVRMKISQSPTGKPYRGCIIENTTKTIQYGKCEVRARVPPSDSGIVSYILLWPADQSWPPEIDFVETSGANANTIIFTQHWGNEPNHPQKSYWLKNINVTRFRRYVVEVTNTSIKWYVENDLGILELITTQTNNSSNQEWIFSAGIWAGNCDGGYGGCPSGSFPKYMDIDYIRLYTKN